MSQKFQELDNGFFVHPFKYFKPLFQQQILAKKKVKYS